MSRKIPVYAIVRLEKYFKDPEEQVAVQSVLPSVEEARAEVDRLNALRDPEKVVYFIRVTRFYPDGRTGSVKDDAIPSSADADVTPVPGS